MDYGHLGNELTALWRFNLTTPRGTPFAGMSYCPVEELVILQIGIKL